MIKLFPNYMKYIKERQTQQKALELNKKKVESAINFNKIIPVTHKHIIIFHDKISFFSAGAISLSTTGLIAIHKSEGNDINQYKYLFLIGIFFLLLALILGIFHRYVNVNSNFWINKINWLEDTIKYERFFNSIPPQEKADSKQIKDLEEIIQETRQKSKKWENRLKRTEFLCPTLFILGLFLITIYLYIQVFTF